MPQDQRVDDYIARAAPFARPILTRLRDAVHAACPQVEEAIKWGMPAFLYKGKPLANMAAFKAHASFGLWRGKEVLGDGGGQDEGMGQFGRLTSVEDLPADEVLAGIIRRAMALTDSGAKPVRAKAAPKPDLAAPPDFQASLDENPAAAGMFAGFSPSARREYIEWVTEAKRPDTRAKRIAQAVEWIAQGKKRNWKYENC